MKSFWITVGIGWIILAVAAAIYAPMIKVPAAIAFPVAAAFLIEFPFYLLPGFPAARELLTSKGKPRAAAILAISAVLPWLVYALGTGHFNFPALVVMVSIAVLMCFWYIAFPAHPAADLLYLSLFAALYLLKVFARVYPTPWPKVDISILGKVMLIRTLVFSFIQFRGGIDAEFRFLPGAREWLSGLRWFAYLLIPTGAAYWALGLVVVRPNPLNIGLVIGTFFGILWTTAIYEEFIFRGMLQSWFGRWFASPIAAIIVTSLLFGSVHLNFHNRFPNWRFALVAAVLGLFCGMARRRTGGIQAGMVAHALTVAVWKMFFTY